MQNKHKFKHFKLFEFTCKCGCGKNNIDIDFVKKLDEARKMAGVPFSIISGCRCEAHNRHSGGGLNSSHLTGLAVDIRTSNSLERALIQEALYIVGIRRFGINRGSIHADADKSKPTPRMWDYYEKDK